ncbi:MAG: PA2778 family cysteine peptidase [Burkholderiales bacterium]|nr:PA2778 family cysteine peptidase [Burkholderiales bacterium]
MRRRKARLCAGFLFFAVMMGGCALIASHGPGVVARTQGRLPPRVELSSVPFFPQDDYQCGPASLAMAMSAAGAAVTPEALIDEVYLPSRKGSLQVEMLAAPRRHGLIGYQLAPGLDEVLLEVAAGSPVIVLENYRVRWWPLWHYAVVVGYDLEAGEVVRRSGSRERQTMPFGVFEYLWQDEGRWAMVVVAPDRVPATATEARYGEAVAALESSGRIRSAHIAYNAMLARWPSSLVGLMGSGNTAYALKDLAAAESWFRDATLAHPGEAAAFNNYAHVLAERGRLPEALAAAEHAVSLGGTLAPAARKTLESIRGRMAARREPATD